MTSVLRSRRVRRMAGLGALLAAAILLLATAACDDTYRLTISSTEGGSVTVPGEGSSTHDAGTVVDLVATPDDGYRFEGWTGDTGTIASTTSASTTITMNGNCTITATFSEEDDGRNGGVPDPVRP